MVIMLMFSINIIMIYIIYRLPRVTFSISARGHNIVHNPSSLESQIARPRTNVYYNFKLQAPCLRFFKVFVTRLLQFFLESSQFKCDKRHLITPREILAGFNKPKKRAHCFLPCLLLWLQFPQFKKREYKRKTEQLKNNCYDQQRKDSMKLFEYLLG